MGTTPAPTLLPYPEQPDQPDFPGDMQALAEAIELAVDALFPTGSIIAFGAANPPAGWARCDGSPHGSAPLQAVIGSPNSPDLRDRFLLGATGAAGKTIRATGGRAPGQINLTAGHVPAHTHAATAPNGNNGHTHTFNASGGTLADDAWDHAHTGPGGLHFAVIRSTPNRSTRTASGAGVAGGNPPIAYAGESGVGASGDNHGHGLTFNAVVSGGITAGHTHGMNADAAGGGQGHGDNPAFYAVTFIIKK